MTQDISMSTAGAGPLAGVRVLDLCRLLPGALATRRLADLGADVVKVEEPGRGDYLRTIPPLVRGVGIMHTVLNRGKRSIEVDLRTPTGVEVLRALIGSADIVVEVSRPGWFTGIGVDFAEICRARPELVVCSITGFGQSGPLSSLPSHGMNMDALAGCVAVSGEPDRPRFESGRGFAMCVELGGVNAALAACAALVRARSEGRGAWLDVSCWDAGVELNRLGLAHLVATGEPLVLVGDLGPLYDTYLTEDGRVVMFAAIERKFWQSFCDGVNRADLAGRWSGADVDFGRDASLYDDLAAIFRTASAAEWSERFDRWGIPGGLVLGLADVLDHPHTKARRLVADRGDGEVPAIASPIRDHLEEARFDAVEAVPGLGEHTDDVLREWLGRAAV